MPRNHWVEVTDVNGCTVREDFVIEDIKLTLSPFDLLIECDISNTDLELEVTAEGGIHHMKFYGQMEHQLIQ